MTNRAGRTSTGIAALSVLSSALLLGFGCTFAPSAWAQQPARMPKIGVLLVGGRADAVCEAKGQKTGSGCFLAGLRALGYVDGSNVVFAYRFAEGDYKRLPALAVELVSLQPDVIYTHSRPGAEAAASATTTIPIVVGPAGEEALTRLAGNLARPAGNLTGITLNNFEQDRKCLEILKELVPRMSRVAVLFNPDNATYQDFPGVLAPAAAQLGVTMSKVEARNVAELPQALAAIASSGADAIFMVDDGVLASTQAARRQVSEFALGRRLPLASSNSRIAADGGLVSFGTDIAALGARAAFYVDKILKGAKPSDLPVERPTTFKLSVNLKTARALGLTIPQSMRVRADEVIQ